MYLNNNDHSIQNVLLCNTYLQSIPEEVIPDIEAEFSAVIFEWMKTTAHEKLRAIKGGFGT